MQNAPDWFPPNIDLERCWYVALYNARALFIPTQSFRPAPFLCAWFPQHHLASPPPDPLISMFVHLGRPGSHEGQQDAHTAGRLGELRMQLGRMVKELENIGASICPRVWQSAASSNEKRCMYTLFVDHPNLKAASCASNSPKPSMSPLTNGSSMFIAAPRARLQNVGRLV